MQIGLAFGSINVLELLFSGFSVAILGSLVGALVALPIYFLVLFVTDSEVDGHAFRVSLWIIAVVALVLSVLGTYQNYEKQKELKATTNSHVSSLEKVVHPIYLDSTLKRDG